MKFLVTTVVLVLISALTAHAVCPDGLTNDPTCDVVDTCGSKADWDCGLMFDNRASGVAETATIRFDFSGVGTHATAAFWSYASSSGSHDFQVILGTYNFQLTYSDWTWQASQAGDVSGDFPSDTWVFIVVKIEDSNNVSLMVDGVHVTGSPRSHAISSSSDKLDVIFTVQPGEYRIVSHLKTSLESSVNAFQLYNDRNELFLGSNPTSNTEWARMTPYVETATRRVLLYGVNDLQVWVETNLFTTGNTHSVKTPSLTPIGTFTCEADGGFGTTNCERATCTPGTTRWSDFTAGASGEPLGIPIVRYGEFHSRQHYEDLTSFTSLVNGVRLDDTVVSLVHSSSGSDAHDCTVDGGCTYHFHIGYLTEMRILLDSEFDNDLYVDLLRDGSIRIHAVSPGDDFTLSYDVPDAHLHKSDNYMSFAFSSNGNTVNVHVNGHLQVATASSTTTTLTTFASPIFLSFGSKALSASSVVELLKLRVFRGVVEASTGSKWLKNLRGSLSSNHPDIIIELEGRDTAYGVFDFESSVTAEDSDLGNLFATWEGAEVPILTNDLNLGLTDNAKHYVQVAIQTKNKITDSILDTSYVHHNNGKVIGQNVVVWDTSSIPSSGGVFTFDMLAADYLETALSCSGGAPDTFVVPKQCAHDDIIGTIDLPCSRAVDRDDSLAFEDVSVLADAPDFKFANEGNEYAPHPYLPSWPKFQTTTCQSCVAPDTHLLLQTEITPVILCGSWILVSARPTSATL